MVKTKQKGIAKWLCLAVLCVVGAFGDRGRLERRDGRILRHCGKERGQRKSEKDD